jgi:ribosomal protein L7Ae-like RNA K-turn-binding protein
MSEDVLKGMIGMAFRARQLVPGAEMSLQLIRDEKAALVMIDDKASSNTAKKLQDACRYRNVPVFVLGDGLLGVSCGRPGMAAAALKAGKIAQNVLKQCEHQEYDPSTTTSNDCGGRGLNVESRSQGNHQGSQSEGGRHSL